MTTKTNLLLLSTIIVFLAFAAGYYFGAENTRARFVRAYTDDAISAQNIVHTNTPENASTNKPTAGSSQNMQTPIQLNLSKEVEANASAVTQPLSASVNSASSVSEIMTHLLNISASDQPQDMEQFGATMQLLQETIKQDPEKIEILLDYFIEADSESRAPYYITSILQGSDVPDREYIMTNLVNRLTAIGSEAANTKMLHLIASTGAHYDNEQIISTIKNIALYSQRQDSNRIYALDLLMPFQLSELEKGKVVSDFTYALDQAPSEEKSYMIENIIRFSDKSERAKLASEYLSDTNDFSTRVAILSTLHNGSVAPSDTLKNQLFSIAQNKSDPLSEHAKNALLYVFEIDNAEYTQLKQTN